MGNFYCCSQSQTQQLKLYGDEFDSNSRALRLILEYCSIDYFYENIDLVGLHSDPNTTLQNYR